MKPSLDTLRDAIFDWVHTVLNTTSFASDGTPTVLDENDPNAIRVIRAENDQVRPKSLFVEFKLLTGLVKQGAVDETLFNTTEDTFFSKGQRDITVSIDAIGAGAQETISIIQNSLNLSYAHNILRSAGLSARGNESVVDQSAFLETNFEERAVLDIIFGVAIETVDPVSRIEDVEIKSNMVGGKTVLIESP